MKIDRQIGKTDAPMPPEEKKQHTDQSGFQPYQPKRRKSGTGCVYQINDHLWEKKYSPRDTHGKRIFCNVYTKTLEERKEKLAIMIEEVKKKNAEEKEKRTVKSLQYADELHINDAIIASESGHPLLWGIFCGKQ